MKKLGIVLGLIWFLWSCQETDSTTSAEFTQAEKIKIAENLEFTGVIRSGNTTKISPEITGKILEIAMQEKDSVTKEQVLFRVLPEEFLQTSDSIKKLLNSAKNELNAKKQASEKAKNQLIEAKKSTPQDLTQAQENYQKQAKILEKARFEVVNLEESLYILEENTLPMEILAPESGIIKQINVRDNERVFKTDSTGTQIAKVWAELIGTGQFEFEAETDNQAVTWLQKGDLAKITLSFEKEQFEGTVQQIISLPEQKYQLIINLEQANTNHKTRSGMTATAHIAVRPKTVLFLPISCVGQNQNENQVVIQDGEKLKNQAVKLGIRRGDKVEIRSGITQKDKVLKNYQTTK